MAMVMQGARTAAVAFAALLTAAADAHERPWYASIEAGANWTSIDGPFVALACGGGATCGPDTSTDMGWAALAAVGTRLTENLRVEVEVGRRTATLADEVSNTTLMLNAVFDIPVSQNIALSLGAGAGADWIATDLGPLSSASDSKTTFAYQLIAGLAFGIGDGLDLTVNYRYLDVSGTDDLLAGTNDIGSSIGGALIRVDEVSSSTVSVGLRFEL